MTVKQLSVADLSPTAAIERITSAAVEAAPGKGANYAHIVRPSEFGPSGESLMINVNAFGDAKVVY